MYRYVQYICFKPDAFFLIGLFAGIQWAVGQVRKYNQEIYQIHKIETLKTLRIYSTCANFK